MTMTKEAQAFLVNNRTQLLKNYREYVESMVESEELEEMENFYEWVEEELRVKNHYEAKGETLNDYE